MQPHTHTPRAGTDGLAVAALVLGICAIPFGWLWLVPPILGIVFGHVAVNRIDHSQGTKSGRGMATAGFICGYVGLVLWGLIFLVALSA